MLFYYFNLEGATAVAEVTEQLSQVTMTSSVGMSNVFTHPYAVFLL